MKRLRSVLAVGLVVLSVAPARAAVVSPGWDLLQTLPGTVFVGAPFTGVPLVSYDFGGAIGVQPTGNTDTIVQRLDVASVPLPPGSDTISVELVALNLVSVNLIDLGLGLDHYYITLQSARGGPTSTGAMTIQFTDAAGGTFDSLLDVFFDVRKGASQGPIALSDDVLLASSGSSWDRDPPPDAVVINGVNHHLNGVDNAEDFWPTGPIRETSPTLVHVVGTAQAIPEPATAVIWVLLGGLSAAYAWRRNRSTGRLK